MPSVHQGAFTAQRVCLTHWSLQPAPGPSSLLMHAPLSVQVVSPGKTIAQLLCCRAPLPWHWHPAPACSSQSPSPSQRTPRQRRRAQLLGAASLRPGAWPKHRASWKTQFPQPHPPLPPHPRLEVGSSVGTATQSPCVAAALHNSASALGLAAAASCQALQLDEQKSHELSRSGLPLQVGQAALAVMCIDAGSTP